MTCVSRSRAAFFEEKRNERPLNRYSTEMGRRQTDEKHD
jgi:hypothetical protein